MNRFATLTIPDLLQAFSSPSPTPGGGSAAALAGAIGASLLAMVAGLPKTRTGSDAERTRLDHLANGLLDGRDHLLSLVDGDADAYDGVTAAYRLPKGTETERAGRADAIQDALRGATDTPLAVMRACHAAARAGIEVAALGNPSASSDARVGLELLAAAHRGAGWNVEVNLASVKDAGYVSSIRAEVTHLETIMADALASARANLGVS